MLDHLLSTPDIETALNVTSDRPPGFSITSSKSSYAKNAPSADNHNGHSAGATAGLETSNSSNGFSSARHAEIPSSIVPSATGTPTTGITDIQVNAHLKTGADYVDPHELSQSENTVTYAHKEPQVGCHFNTIGAKSEGDEVEAETCALITYAGMLLEWSPTVGDGSSRINGAESLGCSTTTELGKWKRHVRNIADTMNASNLFPKFKLKIVDQETIESNKGEIDTATFYEGQEPLNHNKYQEYIHEKWGDRDILGSGTFNGVPKVVFKEQRDSTVNTRGSCSTK